MIRRPYVLNYAPSTMHRKAPLTFLLGILVLQIMLSSTVAKESSDSQFSEQEAWPDGSRVYDNMVQMADFGYRQIDT